MKHTFLILTLILACSALIQAQRKSSVKVSNSTQIVKNSVENALIDKEKQKWDWLAKGRWNELKDMFADDFVSIGYQPDGSVKLIGKAESFAASGALPAGINFVLSDFKIVSADKKNLVVTYQATGPIKVQATSHWTKRGKNWQTVFYQATMIR